MERNGSAQTVRLAASVPLVISNQTTCPRQAGAPPGRFLCTEGRLDCSRTSCKLLMARKKKRVLMYTQFFKHQNPPSSPMRRTIVLSMFAANLLVEHRAEWDETSDRPIAAVAPAAAAVERSAAQSLGLLDSSPGVSPSPGHFNRANLSHKRRKERGVHAASAFTCRIPAGNHPVRLC